jgi:hypothetical protein
MGLMFSFIETKLFSRLFGEYLTDDENGEQSIPAHVLRKIKEEIDD